MSSLLLGSPSCFVFAFIFTLVFTLSGSITSVRLTAQPLPPPADNTTVEVVRNFGGELFRMNSVPYLEPLVSLLNATTNARTFHTAVVGNPAKKGNHLYIRAGVHVMSAFVRPDQKTYRPQLPNEPFDVAKVLPFLSGNLLSGQVGIRDTAGLVSYATRVLIYEGLRDGSIQVPEQTSTFFGNLQQSFTIPKAYFRNRLRQGLFGLRLSAPAEASVLAAIEQLPDEFPLPSGQNLNLLPLAVPQVEIGSFYGTELLVRFIPQIDWGNNIGRFGFWGVGLKHNISQYLATPPFELAAQGVVQGTTLTNRIGVTGAELFATANIFTFNIHASKRFNDVEVFTGLSYDNLSINGSYTFVLPFQLQAQLRLLRPVERNGTIEYVVDVANGFPGDTKPQTALTSLQNSSIRWTVGATVHLGPVRVVADYNLSSLSSMLTAGLVVQF
jgi:hypothetical protein